MKEFKVFLHSFNPGKVWITANAGTGKTFTIIWSALRLILEEKLQASEIIILTFTNKVADELEQRLHSKATEIIDLLHSNSENFKQGSTNEREYILNLKSKKGQNKLIELLITSKQVTVSTIDRWVFNFLDTKRLESHFLSAQKIQPVSYNLLEQVIQDVWRSYKNSDLHAMSNILVSPKKLQELFLKLYNYHSIKTIPDIKNDAEFEQFSNQQISPAVHKAYLCSMLLNKISEKYENSKKINAVYDFKDLYIILDNLLKKTSLSLTNGLDKHYKGWFIDEFQDTNEVQINIIEKLIRSYAENSKENYYMCVVGDPKQSIYAFRGADLDGYLNLQEKIPPFQIFKLAQNYRSSSSLNKALNHIYKTNHNPFLDERIIYFESHLANQTNTTISNDLENINCAAIDFIKILPDIKLNKDEAKANILAVLIPSIKDMLKSSSQSPSLEQGVHKKAILLQDIAILVPTNADALSIFEKLKIENIEANLVSADRTLKDIQQKNFFVDLVNLGQILENPAEASQAMINNFLVSKLVGLDILELAKLNESEFKKQILDLIISASIIFKACGILESFIFLNNSSLIDQLQKEYKFRLNYEEDEVYNNQLQHLLLIIQKAELTLGSEFNFQDLSNAPDLLNDFLENTSIESKDAIKIMTYHNAKGLEFPIVIAPFLGISRHYMSRDGALVKKENSWLYILDNSYLDETISSSQVELKEERRIIYTVLTRAKFKLIIFLVNYSRSKNQLNALELLLTDEIKQDRSQVLQKISELCVQYSTLFNEKVFLTEDEIKNYKNIHLKSELAISKLPLENDLHVPQIENNFIYIKKNMPSTNTNAIKSKNLLASFSNLFANKKIEHLTVGSINKSSKLDHYHLPKNLTTGNFFHDILFNWDFKKLEPQNFTDHHSLEDKINYYFNLPDGKKKENLLQTTEEILTKLQNFAFDSQNHKNFNSSQTKFNLSQTKFLSKEWEFYIAPNDDVNWNELLQKLANQNQIELREEQLAFSHNLNTKYLQGFLDLVAEHAGVIYIFDWKTNFLADYSVNSILSNFKSNNYLIQALIYSFALKKYLQSINAQSLSDKNFGGVFYVYLRGLDQDQGIHHIPTQEILDWLG